jgi:3-oxoacyl-[acyl-carrier protein] reductase
VTKAIVTQFAGRKVVITGAAGLYGHELTNAFAEAGAQLCLSDRRADRLSSLAQSLALPSSRQVLTHVTDLIIEQSVSDLIETIRIAWGAPDIVINNAGIYPFGGLLETDIQQWDEVIDTNLRAPFLIMQGMGRLMLAERKRGCFVNVSSGAAAVLRLNGVPYCVSKRALEWLSDAFALEFANSGIRVNCVRPGLAVGSGLAVFPPGYVEAMSAQNPMGRIAIPGELAAAVMFLSSEDAAYITGQSLDVNGGSSIPHRAGPQTGLKPNTR